MNAEGWYVDPFRAHQARWFSDGLPTKLVRDGTKEFSDDPPNATYEGRLTPIEPEGLASVDDLRRADDAETASDSRKGMQAMVDSAALDFFDPQY
jgi:hypothetical protein